MVLVTRNIKHFTAIQQVSELKIENWFEGWIYGAQEKALETAANMLRKKYPVIEISELTGLPQEQILELQKKVTVQA